MPVSPAATETVAATVAAGTDCPTTEAGRVCETQVGSGAGDFAARFPGCNRDGCSDGGSRDGLPHYRGDLPAVVAAANPDISHTPPQIANWEISVRF